MQADGQMGASVYWQASVYAYMCTSVYAYAVPFLNIFEPQPRLTHFHYRICDVLLRPNLV